MSRGRRSLPGGLEHEVESEIRHHLVEATDQLIEEGWDPEGARKEAERRFGDAHRVRHEVLGVSSPSRLAHLSNWGGSLLLDLRYALRGLTGRPGFTAALLTTLALGLGAATAIFAVADALLVRPLGFRDPGALVQVNMAREDGISIASLSAARFEALSTSGGAFVEGWVAYAPTQSVSLDDAAPRGLVTLGVTPGADALLGLPLRMGRTPLPEDAVPGAEDVVVLSHRYWTSLGSPTDIVGRTLRLDSGAATVIGVLGGGIKFPMAGPEPDLWAPLRTDHSVLGEAQKRLIVWARLRDGTTPTSAQVMADDLTAALAEAAGDQPWGVTLQPLTDRRVNPDVRAALKLLVGTVALIFLIALVNGVNLVLVRTEARAREFAVRLALGGSRGRLLRQLLVEGLLLGAAGGAAAAGLAWIALSVLGDMIPREVTAFSPHAFGFEGRALAFAFAGSLLVGTVLGAVPVRRLLRMSSRSAALGRGGRDGSAGAGRLRAGLVILQVALSMTLLAGAGLLVKSIVRLIDVDPGYAYERLATATITPSPSRYPDDAARLDLVQRLENALRNQAGVSGVTVTSGTGFWFGTRLQAEGGLPPEEQPMLVPMTTVAENYLDVMGIPLLEGRGLRPSDAPTRGAVIDSDLAGFLWGSQSALGRRFRVDDDGVWRTVVGVVGDLHLMGRDQRDGPDQVLLAADGERVQAYLEVIVRTEGDSRALLPLIERTLAEVDPEQPIQELQTAAAALADAEQKPRFVVTLMSLLAMIAVTLASVGLYGVLSYSVSRRRRELGIRMALGADRLQLRSLVLKEGLMVAVVGVALGLGGALLSGRGLSALLYEVDARDPQTMGSTAALFLLIAAAASLIPAHRATQVDPVEVLGTE